MAGVAFQLFLPDPQDARVIWLGVLLIALLVFLEGWVPGLETVQLRLPFHNPSKPEAEPPGDLGSAFLANLRQYGGPVSRQTTVHYFADRAALDAASPLSEQFKLGNEIYAFWIAGQGVFQNHPDVLTRGVIRKLVLPHPDTPALVTLRESIENKEMYPLPEDIRSGTKLARRHGIPVRWYRGFLGVGGHIGNAGKTDAWVMVELTLPFIEPTKRQSLRLETLRQGHEVKAWIDWYERLWSASEEPEI